MYGLGVDGVLLIDTSLIGVQGGQSLRRMRASKIQPGS